MKFLKYLFFSLLIFFTSCDPPHDLIFINQGSSVAKVKIQIDTTLEYNEFSKFDELKSDTIVYNLKPLDTCVLFFGIGTWSEKEIKKIANLINKLEIENADFKETYKTKARIEQTLLEKREDKTGWKTKIIFEIK